MPFVFPLLFLFLLALIRLAFFFGGDPAGWTSALLAALTVTSYLIYSLPQKGLTFVRGRRQPIHAERGQGNYPPGESLSWGGEELPAQVATTHFLVAGTTGAGKTLLLNKLMESVLPYIGKRGEGGAAFDRRALIYDAKGDMYSTLHQLTDARIVTLHPFDQRGAAWDIARDIATPAAALQMASILVPQDRNATGNPFFILAAQNLMRGALLCLMQTVGNDWTFRDVLLALRFEDRLRQLLEKTLEGRGILDQFFRGSSEMLQGVRATVATKIAPYEVIAAAWDRAAEKVSLREFINGEFVLVLGNDEETRTALDAINRVLFKRLSELILSGSETKTRQTWIFLDEVREAGNLEGLSRLMTKGRSKGACIALGFQAIEGMREVYGDNVASEITGLCNNKAILRLESPPSAQWASELFGKAELIDRRESMSRSQTSRTILPGRSRSISEQRLTTDSVLASEIMTLPVASTETGLHGLFITREKGAYRKALPWGRIVPKKTKRGNEIADFCLRDEKAQYLRDWDSEDFDRVNLKSLRVVSQNSIPSFGQSEVTDKNLRVLKSRKNLGV